MPKKAPWFDALDAQVWRSIPMLLDKELPPEEDEDDDLEDEAAIAGN